MHLETIHFPSDTDNAFGSLSRELCKALHTASEHKGHAELLDKFLKFSTAQLKVAKKDYAERLKVMEKRAEAKRLAEEAKAIADKEALYGKVTAQIEELTAEQKKLEGELTPDKDEE